MHGPCPGVEGVDDVDAFLNEFAIGCVVLRSEHTTLTKVSKDNPDLEGWDRYDAAKIDYEVNPLEAK